MEISQKEKIKHLKKISDDISLNRKENIIRERTNFFLKILAGNANDWLNLQHGKPVAIHTPLAVDGMKHGIQNQWFEDSFEILISDTIIKEKDFCNYHFHLKTTFKNVHFTNAVTFDCSQACTTLSFDNVTFENDASFQRSDLSNFEFINGTRFKKKATFDHSNTHKFAHSLESDSPTVFENVFFDKAVSFHASGEKSKSKDEDQKITISFINCDFDHDLDLNCIHADKIDINKSTIKHSLLINNSTIEKLTIDETTLCSSHASKKHIDNESPSIFIENSEIEITTFEKTKFFSNNSFANTNFQTLAFIDVDFFQEADFEHIKSKHIYWGGYTKFHNCIPSFINMTINDSDIKYHDLPSIKFLGEIIPKSSNESRCRHLKNLAISDNNHLKEAYFFNHEIKSKATSDNNKSLKFMIWAYEFFSDFGQNIYKPILWLALIWPLSTFILSAALMTPVSSEDLQTLRVRDSILIEGKKICPSPVSQKTEFFMLAGRYTANALTPVNIGTPREIHSVSKCLFGDSEIPPTLSSVFLFFVKLLGFILIFLLGLGIRNNFKIK